MSIESQKPRPQKYADKIRHEFFTICMLNALFGNPNLHLIQLHNKYHGPKNLQRMVKAYGDKSLTTEFVIALDKKRRNAVTEVLRFYNRIEFKSPDCPINNASDD